jgi:hypothetical protein
VVKAVDENGKPTEWECADFPEAYATLTSPDGTEWTLVVSNDGILSAITKADQYDIFIIGGQSNVVGYGTPMLSTDTFPDKTYQYKQDGSIEAVANYPLDHLEAYANQIGFQHTFLDAYIEDGKLESGRKILLIPCGHPGTSFVSGRWAEGGDLQTAMMNRITAVKNLVGNNGRFKAILWHQGESDVVENNTVTNYKAQLGKLIDNARAITGDIPFIMGEWQQDWLETYNDRGIQMQAVLSELAAEKKNCYLVSADGLSGDSKNGTIHFSAEAQRTFGERYYAGYKAVLNMDNLLREATLYGFDNTATSGWNNGSLVFDGVDDYATLPAETFNFGSNDFTIHVIGKFHDESQVMFSQSNYDHSISSIQIFSARDVVVCMQVYFSDGTKIDRTYNFDSFPIQAHSYAFVRKGNTIDLIVDDEVFYSENVGTKEVVSSASPVTFGRWGDNARMYFNGEVAYFNVHNSALTVDELMETAANFGIE